MSKLVTNQKKVIQEILCNLLPQNVRKDTLEGRSYDVVPMVMLTEGVHQGSLGPLLYPKEELAKTPVVWNHKPIVVYHPEMNGVGVSACDPVIINSRKVGLIMNTKFTEGRLTAEAWIENDRAQAVDERIVDAIKDGEVMELSTGLFVDVEPDDGAWKDEGYVGIAKNYRPDHLALLPDQIGACSIQDGAGFLRNKRKDGKQVVPFSVLQRALEKMGIIGNELSHSDVHSAVSTALRERFGGTTVEGPWVLDIFDNFAVYELDGKLWRLGYTSNDSEIRLSDETPVEVVRVSEYRTVENKQERTVNIMDKETKALVDAIVGNSKWSDEDRERLGKLPKPQLETMAGVKKISPNVGFAFSKDGAVEVVKNDDTTPATKPAAPATPAPEGQPAPAAPAPEGQPASQPAPAAKPDSQPVGNASKIITVDEYINAAPEGLQDVLRNGVDMHNEEKVQLTTAILANENNTFSEDELKGRPLGELRKIAQLMGSKQPEQIRQPTYAGQGPVPNQNTEKEEALEIPALNFDKK